MQTMNINALTLGLQSCKLNECSSYMDDNYNFYFLPEHTLTSIVSTRNILVQNELLAS